MNALVTLIDGNAVTTSIAIADGTENDHASVIKLTRAYQADLEEFGPLGFEIQKGKSLPQGGFAKATEYAILNEQQATLLLTYMRNSDIVRKFKKALVKAFFELAQRKPTDLSRMDILKLAMESEQARIAAESRVAELTVVVEEQAPKADVYDRIVVAEGDMPISLAAKSLGINPLKRLFAWMHENDWIFKRVGSDVWIGHQDKVKRGLLDHKNHTVRLDDGSEKIYPRVVVTPKGLAMLAMLVPKDMTMASRTSYHAPKHQPIPPP